MKFYNDRKLKLIEKVDDLLKKQRWSWYLYGLELLKYFDIFVIPINESFWKYSIILEFSRN
jgi:hypothetical protein